MPYAKPSRYPKWDKLSKSFVHPSRDIEKGMDVVPIETVYKL
jgi:hypothetical protein